MTKFCSNCYYGFIHYSESRPGPLSSWFKVNNLLNDVFVQILDTCAADNNPHSTLSLRLNHAQLQLNARNVFASAGAFHSPTFATPKRRKHVAVTRANDRLWPSDFVFLWEECKRCFYLKVHGDLPRLQAPFPSVCSSIDLGMKRHMRGLQTDRILPGMRPGTILCENDDAWIESQPITLPGHSHSVYIRGKV